MRAVRASERAMTVPEATMVGLEVAFGAFEEKAELVELLALILAARTVRVEVIMVSASAKARECSKMDMPTSVITGYCWREHDRLSMRCEMARRRNEGQSNENEPYGALVSASGRAIPTILQACSSVVLNRTVELIVYRVPPSVDQSNGLYLSLSPCR